MSSRAIFCKYFNEKNLVTQHNKTQNICKLLMKMFLFYFTCNHCLGSYYFTFSLSRFTSSLVTSNATHATQGSSIGLFFRRNWRKQRKK